MQPTSLDLGLALHHTRTTWRTSFDPLPMLFVFCAQGLVTWWVLGTWALAGLQPHEAVSHGAARWALASALAVGVVAPLLTPPPTSALPIAPLTARAGEALAVLLPAWTAVPILLVGAGPFPALLGVLLPCTWAVPILTRSPELAVFTLTPAALTVAYSGHIGLTLFAVFVLHALWLVAGVLRGLTPGVVAPVDERRTTVASERPATAPFPTDDGQPPFGTSITAPPPDSFAQLLVAFARSTPVTLVVGPSIACLVALAALWADDGSMHSDVVVMLFLFGGAFSSGLGRFHEKLVLHRRYLPFRQRLVPLDVALRVLWMVVLGVVAIAIAMWLGLPRGREPNAFLPWVFALHPLQSHYAALPDRPYKWLWPVVWGAGAIAASAIVTVIVRSPEPVWSLVSLTPLSLSSLALCALVWRETPPDRSAR